MGYCVSAAAGAVCWRAAVSPIFRPVVVKMSRTELEKMFKRIV